MSKRLGLDIGTNSAGWNLVNTQKKGNQIITKGVLIFSEGVKTDKKIEKSKASERTLYRSARKLKFRRKLRKYETLKVLVKHKMCPLEIQEVIKWRASNFKEYPSSDDFLHWLRTEDKENKNPYYFRDKASKEKVHGFELGRALYHIAQRRGYKSNRLDESDESVIQSKKEKILEIIERGDYQNNYDLIELIEEEVFSEYDLINKSKSKCESGTESKLWSTRHYIIEKVLKNKIKDKNFSNIEDAKEEIKRFVNKSENLGKVEGSINDLTKKMHDTNSDTLGQLFWKLYQKDRNDSRNKIRNQYTAREEHYREEFDIICDAQALKGIDKKAKKKYSGVVKELYDAIFFQRDLKSQKGQVGKCSLEPKRKRCPISRPEYERYRMFSFINNIKIKEPDGSSRSLSDEEKQKITYRNLLFLIK